MKQLLAAFIVLVGSVGLVACAPASSVPVAEQASAAPAVQETVPAAEPTPDPVVVQRAARERERARGIEYRKIEVRNDLAILEGSSSREIRMADVMRGADVELKVCELIDRAYAGRRLLANNAVGYQEAVGALGIDRLKVELGQRTVTILASKELFRVLQLSPPGTCRAGTEGQFDLSDAVAVFGELASIYDDAKLTSKDVGFTSVDVRRVLLGKARGTAKQYHSDLGKGSNVGSGAYFAINEFLKVGFTAGEIGLSEAEASHLRH